MNKAILFLVLLAAVLLLAGCRENQGPAAEPAIEAADLSERPIQQFFDYKLVESSVGVPKWVLVSDQMNKYAGQRDAELITVKIDFYRDGALFSTLTADSGLANLQTKDIHTWGDVVLINVDGRRLDTQELFFDNTRQIIHNDVYDLFTEGDDVVEGIGLEATPDLEYFEIKSRVEADVLDDPERDQRRHAESGGQ